MKHFPKHLLMRFKSVLTGAEKHHLGSGNAAERIGAGVLVQDRRVFELCSLTDVIFRFRCPPPSGNSHPSKPLQSSFINKQTCLNVCNGILHAISVCSAIPPVASVRQRNGLETPPRLLSEGREGENKKIKEQKNSTGEQQKGSSLTVPWGGRWGLTC